MGGTMHKRGTMRLATAIAMAMAVPAPSAGAGIILPPELDYASHCRPSEAAAPPLDRDWSQWPGGALALPVEEVTALAAEYARGSGRVAQSADTALRLLTALDGQIDPHRLDRLIGRILAAPERSAEEQAAGEARLLRAFAGGRVTRRSTLPSSMDRTGRALCAMRPRRAILRGSRQRAAIPTAS